MKAEIRQIDDHGRSYEALAFVCPGCALDGQSGLHMLPVRGDTTGHPRWDWDGNLDAPTLSPSILTHMDHRRAKQGDEWVDVGPFVCHSFLRAGQFEFLGDCTHSLAGQTVPMPDLADWQTK